MLAGIHAFEIFETIVEDVPVPMVDMAIGRDRPKSRCPSIPMKFLATARQVTIAWPKSVEAAVEILRDFVKVDRIAVVGVNDLADFHPLSVKNK